MSKIISVREIQQIILSGQMVRIPEDALLTPAARELLNELESGGGAKAAVPLEPPGFAGDATPSGPAVHLNSRSPKAELEAFFHSPHVHSMKLQICETGRRLWQRAYVDGNGGNLAIRVGEDLALCTPTMVSKGSLRPEDLCLVDFEGTQLLGARKQTSEILMHVQMMKRQPRAVATCHCHPPHATAFAIAGVVPPQCLLPEYEILCSVGIAPYRTPRSPEMGRLVAELTGQYDTILMSNHGVVSWSHNSLEEAYWRMEVIEAYCRTVVVARQLGNPLNTFTSGQMKELLDIKQSFGFVDPRYERKD